MKRPDSVKCENCIFSKPSIDDPKQLICRFNPPTITDRGVGWARVEDSWWCGRFKPKDNLTTIEWVAWMKMLKPESVKCENCLFYDKNGMCNRYPPQLVPTSSNKNVNVNGSNNGGSYSETHNGGDSFYCDPKHPLVHKDDFCGEFLPKDNLTALEWVAWKKGLLEDANVPK